MVYTGRRREPVKTDNRPTVTEDHERYEKTRTDLSRGRGPKIDRRSVGGKGL